MGWFNLAVCLERRRVGRRVEAFHKACTLDSEHVDAHLGLGVCHLRLEDPKSALFCFERCLELIARHEDAQFGKAAALQSLGHPDEAAQIYQKILERNPESEESLSNLILIGMAKEDFDMVREYSERLLELRPESTVALEGLAAWACAAGEHALTAKFCTLLVPPCPAISRAGSTWGWRIRNRGAGSRRPKPTRKRSSCARNPGRPTPIWGSCASSWATPPARARPTNAR